MSETAFLITNKETKADCLNYIWGLRKEDGEMVVSVKPFKATRSQNQNRLYWAMLGDVARETGHSTDELHELFKGKFLGHKESMVLGEKVDFVPSTTKLTTIEMSEYVERIVAFLAQAGIHVSLPGDL